MEVSIIIINYRTSGLIVDSLETVYQFTKGVSFEVIVVNNEEDAEGKEKVIRRFPEVRWVEMGYNAGFGRANNAGMRIAQGRFFLLLNADTLLVDDVISRCVRRMEADAHIVAGAALQYDADRQPMHYYQSFNDFRKTFFIFPPGRLFQKLMNRLLPEPTYREQEQKDWLVGAFMMVRKEAFQKTGGFEECFFMYGEDVEWSGRLGKMGKLFLFHDCIFLHLENQNPYRRSRISWINRFSVQMQVSNMVWLRKQYGVIFYLIMLSHYLTMIPVVYGWRFVMNLKEKEAVRRSYVTQHIFTKKVFILFKYFWRTLDYRGRFFKIKPEENIDKLYAD
jgi:GT2 family glycosyltransferase